MIYLEKVICSEISEEAQIIHAALSNSNGDEFINMTFKLEIKDADELDRGFKQMFDEL